MRETNSGRDRTNAKGEKGRNRQKKHTVQKEEEREEVETNRKIAEKSIKIEKNRVEKRVREA